MPPRNYLLDSPIPGVRQRGIGLSGQGNGSVVVVSCLFFYSVVGTMLYRYLLRELYLNQYHQETKRHASCDDGNIAGDCSVMSSKTNFQKEITYGLSARHIGTSCGAILKKSMSGFAIYRDVTQHERSSNRRRLDRKFDNLTKHMAGITETRDNERHTDVGISNRERVLVVNDCVSEGSSQLLARGPAFVFSTGVTTAGERSEVETAVERMAFTLRWQASKPEEIELQQPTEDRLDSKLHRLIPRGFKQPLPGTPEDELCLSNFKRDVLAVYDNFKPLHSQNITKEDRQELRNLKQKADVVIKPSDKSKKLVAMPKQEYVQKAEAILADNGMYEPVDVTISSLEKRTREIIASECSGMDSKLRTAIMPSDTRFPEWYGLPKDHKQNLPLRPVVSACDSPTTALSIVLERILNQLLQFAPAHLKNTTECLSNIKQVYPNLCAPEGTILVTMDVVGLYPSIPITEGIQVVIETLQDHAHEIDMLGLSVNSIENLLQYVLTSNYFRFGSRICRQVEGVAMGNNLAPPFAILFMNAMESRQLSESPESPICYRRYIDDIFFMWTHGQAKLKEFC